MRLFHSSLLDLKSLSQSQIYSFFDYVSRMKGREQRSLYSGKTLSLFFVEPSTRTRLSFETAAHRCGLQCLVVAGATSTSLEKGETVEDSLLNIEAMDPVALVVRCGDAVKLRELSQLVKKPIINAGWGIEGHPTQALLDLYTIFEKRGKLDGLKILFVGDVAHSRVAASHFEVAGRLGLSVGICSNKRINESFQNFDNLEEATRWADVIYVLRWQFERHEEKKKLEQSHMAQLTVDLRHLQRSDQLLMHPGPVNHGLELTTEAYRCSQSVILDQVRNGVHTREALLRLVLEGGL